MSIISFNFLLFFLIFFFIYYLPFKEKINHQNVLLLFASYFFYGCADIKMLPILIIATIAFYYLGIAIDKTKNKKKSSWLTTLGVVVGVGILFYFKYFNFFITSFTETLASIGFSAHWKTFTIIMPLGISFFTFKLISYVIEVDRGKIEPTKNLISFATYVAFFPTIMSGPIDRPNIFIPQIQNKRPFNYGLAVDGCRQILWGLFQKTVIANNLAFYSERIWGNIQGSNSSALLLMAILYSFQMYTDFSGYSHMAIGIGKLLGFNITKNFNYPFFATNIADYWRRWHISLTSWLTDYVFMPLNVAFRTTGNWGVFFAIFINMIVVGMWHGANWTFIVFGMYHGLLFIPIILSGSFFKKKKQKVNKYDLPSLNDLFKMIGTFMLVTIGLVIFKADTIEQALQYITHIFSPSLFMMPNFDELNMLSIIILFIVLFVFLEWKGRNEQYAIARLGLKWKSTLRYAFYYAIIFAIIMFGDHKQEFIYFQF